MAQLRINPRSTAFLILNCQNDALLYIPSADQERVLSNVAKTAQACRRLGIPVIYVLTQFREGYPEVSPRNLRFWSIKEAHRLREGTADARVAYDVRPQPGDILVSKRRTSAFTGNDLQYILEAKAIDTLALAGIATRAEVDATGRTASDLDYHVLVLEDCCADRDPEAHKWLVKKLFPFFTTVCTSEDFLRAIL